MCKERLEFLQHNIAMYFKNYLGHENVEDIIYADRVVLKFNDSLDFNKVLNVLNKCIVEFDEDIKKVKNWDNIVSSFEIFSISHVIKFNYKRL